MIEIIPPDIVQWLAEYRDFGKQVIYLDESSETPANRLATVARLPRYQSTGHPSSRRLSPTFLL
jgi:hypothetical protein